MNLQVMVDVLSDSSVEVVKRFWGAVEVIKETPDARAVRQHQVWYKRGQVSREYVKKIRRVEPLPAQDRLMKEQLVLATSPQERMVFFRGREISMLSRLLPENLSTLSRIKEGQGDWAQFILQKKQEASEMPAPDRRIGVEIG
jgi:hypothetical protein